MLMLVMMDMVCSSTCCQLPCLRLLTLQPQIGRPAKHFHGSNLFSSKHFDVSQLLSVFLSLSMYLLLCEDFQAWNLFQQSVDRVTKARYATTSPIQMLLPSYRGFSNTFKRSWHCLSTHRRAVQFPWQPNSLPAPSKNTELNQTVL